MQKRIWVGIVLLVIGLLPFSTFIFSGNVQYAVWFSNHTFIILGLAVLINSRFWVLAEFCLGAIPELVWSVDFLWQVFTGVSPFGLTEYMFEGGAFNVLHLYSLQHILFVPACVYSLYILKGFVSFAFIGSIVHGIAIWIWSFLFSPEYNLNCVYYPCTFSLPYYRFAWPLLVIVQIVLIYLLCVLFLKKRLVYGKARSGYA